ncbi:MAG: hypothetical protein AVDCRST_MAG16-1721, partial [uncultured Frankineae bacterium]
VRRRRTGRPAGPPDRRGAKRTGHRGERRAPGRPGPRPRRLPAPRHAGGGCATVPADPAHPHGRARRHRCAAAARGGPLPPQHAPLL